MTIEQSNNSPNSSVSVVILPQFLFSVIRRTIPAMLPRRTFLLSLPFVVQSLRGVDTSAGATHGRRILADGDRVFRAWGIFSVREFCFE